MQLYESRFSRVAYILIPAIIILAYLCMFVPFLRMSNTAPLVLLAAIGAITCFFQKQRRLTYYAIICLLFFAYLLLADRLLHTNQSGTAIYRRIICAFFCGTALYYALRQKWAYFLHFTGSCLLITIVIAACWYVYDPAAAYERLFLDGRLRLFHGHPNPFSYYLSVTLLACMLSLIWKPKPYKIIFANVGGKFTPMFASLLDILCCRPIMLAATAASIACLLLSASRTGLLATIGGCFAFFAYYCSEKFGIKRTIAALLVTFAIGIAGAEIYFKTAPAVENSKAHRIMSGIFNPTEDPTFKSRMPIWESALHSAKQSVIFGNGPKSFLKETHLRYIEDNYDNLVEKYGKYIIDNDTKNAPNAHNQYLQILTEEGLVGLLFLLAILVYPISAGFVYNNIFGMTVPLMVHYMIFSITETTLQGNFNASFPATILFMSVGYFSCLHRVDYKKPLY